MASTVIYLEHQYDYTSFVQQERTYPVPAPSEIISLPHFGDERRQLLLSSVCLSDLLPDPPSLVMGAREGLRSVLGREEAAAFPEVAETAASFGDPGEGLPA